MRVFATCSDSSYTHFVVSTFEKTFLDKISHAHATYYA